MSAIRMTWAGVVVVFLLAVSGVHAADPPPEDGEIDEAPPALSPSSAAAPRIDPKRVVVESDGTIRVPGGAFTMGSSDPKAPANERPPHAVTVKPFFLDRTEVTVGAYHACVSDRRCRLPPKTSAQCTFDLGDAELPITCVRWADADTFCRVHKKRLPTEAEWELAAKGSNPANFFPWGGSRATCSLAATLVRDTTSRSCTGARPARVATHPAGVSPFGLHDLSGNAEEWVADYYAEHLARVAPRAGSSHVLRGGGWLSAPSASRTTSRNWGSAEESGPNTGFRCARD